MLMLITLEDQQQITEHRVNSKFRHYLVQDHNYDKHQVQTKIQFRPICSDDRFVLLYTCLVKLLITHCTLCWVRTPPQQLLVNNV